MTGVQTCALPICIVFMADGQIIEEGTPDHFFDNPSNERVKQFLGKIIR